MRKNYNLIYQTQINTASVIAITANFCAYVVVGRGVLADVERMPSRLARDLSPRVFIARSLSEL